jgi:hypothetical protein
MKLSFLKFSKFYLILLFMLIPNLPSIFTYDSDLASKSRNELYLI